jgi:hypothetical protein
MKTLNYDITTPEGMQNSKRWLSSVLMTLGDNGIWGIPRSGTVVRIDKQSKTATVVYQDSPEISTELVFEALGRTVVYNDSEH